MYISETKLRVRYGETDKMGYSYYGAYATYFEVARVEAMRQLGMSYKVMEESGVMLPVLDLQVKYIKPAFYDEELTIKTYIKEIPKVRIHFEYEVYNEKQELINKANTTLVFIDMKSNRPCAAPNYFIKNLEKYFKK